MLSQHADAVEALLKREQLDGFEIMVSSSKDLSLESKEGKVDSYKVAEPFGIAIRVLKGDGLGFSFSTTLEPAALSRMVEGALTAARMQTPDAANSFPLPQVYPEPSGIYDAELEKVPHEEKVERALQLERLALSGDPRVKRVRKCSYSESVFDLYLRNSFGVTGAYRGSYVSCSASAVAEADGAAQIGWDFDYATGYAGIDVEKIARGAIAKATSLLGARSMATMRVPVILDNYVATQLLDIVAASFLVENVEKGKSLFKGKVGEQVFSPLVSVRDNGLLDGGMGTAPWDGEGVPQQDVELVRAGELKGFLCDTFWGQKAGVASTGNSVRGSLRSPPRTGVHNLFVEKGKTSPEALREGMEKGVLITEVMGMHTANPISGDFSVGAAGFYVERGEIVHPVKGIAIAGNVLELFQRVDLVADDLRFFGGTGAPALRIAELDVSGS
ncbi:TldD/PmbA family protein [Geomesophilobacter sediminis]|uniref:TldD/PmbA family protein n=1 Tax=Geomesophilobacter sediminis TaxID=2798584 RepID=A0A8J7IZJ3_9BACT|nr:TldD/PmbA family protein [Geomesophilobacter sediminis]MBJ6723553.1 TldD/PmbA family protein [Geomesophilobacter sediminis]